MGRSFVRLSCLVVGVFLALTSSAVAQSAISGVVRDTSGAVMPGVTVEAASPVLIEKVRTAVTDEQGRYTIIDLRPGVYTVTFTLSGFNTYRQEGLELPANFTATINAEMRVGRARGIGHGHRGGAARGRPEHAAQRRPEPRADGRRADRAELLAAWPR